MIMAQAPNTTRVTATIPDEMHKQLLFYAAKKGISINQYLYDALEHAIAWENQDYPLSTIETARLAQLVDIVSGVKSDVENIHKVIDSGFNSLLTLTKGDNYLLDGSEDDVE